MVELGDQFVGLADVQVQLVGQLALAHAVHQPQANGLGRLAANACHVGHHLVKVRIRVFPISVYHYIGPRQIQEACIVDQQSRFLRTKVIGCPKLTFLRQEQVAHHWANDFVAGGHLLEVGVGHGQPSCNRAPIVTAHLVDVWVDASCLGAEL